MQEYGSVPGQPAHEQAKLEYHVIPYCGLGAAARIDDVVRLRDCHSEI
jgi:hypothetical protein